MLTMIKLFGTREPSEDESRVFTALAADAASLGTLLRRTSRIKVDTGSAVDLGDGNERELLAAALRAGAAQHVRAGEDLLTLLERLNRMIEVSVGKRDPQRRTELALQLLRAMASCELLETEWRERFPAHEPLGRLARDTNAALARGYLRALGKDVDPDLRRAFPRFARAVRAAAADAGTGASFSLFRRWSLTSKKPSRDALAQPDPAALRPPPTRP